MKITRVNNTYAWAKCEAPYSGSDRKTCANTVKFCGEDGCETCCPACATLWVCNGEQATISGYMSHLDNDDYDMGTPVRTHKLSVEEDAAIIKNYEMQRDEALKTGCLDDFFKKQDFR